MSTLHPYQRIVAEFRRKIAAGELSPGERMPSARQIRDSWGVSLATAAKVLTTLRHEGVVVSRPRAATIVAGATRRPSRQRQPSEPGEFRTSLIATAIALADTAGLEAVTIRAVASRLDIATMSVYAHVTSKADLIMLMTDAAFGEASYPDQPPPGWRSQLELGLRTLWRLFRAHPWLAQTSPLIRPVPLPKLLAHSEWAFRALEGLGLDPVTRRNIVMHGYNYVHSLANHLEHDIQSEATTGLSGSQWTRLQQPAMATAIASGQYPAFARIIGELSTKDDRVDPDELFEFGLRPHLDGLEVLINSFLEPFGVIYVVSPLGDHSQGRQ
jgi:DNA-binding transcriptional regulator YhcF (GntR family)